MPFLPSPRRRLAFVAVVIVLSGLLWLLSWQVAHTIFGFTTVKPSITLVYLPAGIRLVTVLVAGVWGAIGIALAFPIALLQVFPRASWQETLAYSCIAGFVPYAAVVAVCRAANVSRDLGSLRSIHLPVLAAAVSVTGALAYSTALVAFGRFDKASFLQDFTAMAAGDFLGCFAVVLLVWMILSGRKYWK